MKQNKELYYLYPSSLYVSEKHELITTILGSCVAVCLWDPKTEIGGMNHYMLPFWNGKGLASPKFGNIAIEKLIQKMEQKGAARDTIVAKVFGGAAVLNTNTNVLNIGNRNIQIAENLLQFNRINITASSMGGENGRKIIFNTKTGEIRHRFIKKTER